MNDTPRTDKQIRFHYDEYYSDTIKYVRPDFARKLERECDELRAALVVSEKKEMATRAVIESWKSMNLELVPNVWTLEHFKSICDIKTPEAAMVSGEQLLELLTDSMEIPRLREELATSDKKVCLARACLDSWKEDEGADAARFAWLVGHDNYSLELELPPVTISRDSIFSVTSSQKHPIREAIDAAMEASQS